MKKGREGLMSGIFGATMACAITVLHTGVLEEFKGLILNN